MLSSVVCLIVFFCRRSLRWMGTLRHYVSWWTNLSLPAFLSSVTVVFTSHLTLLWWHVSCSSTLTTSGLYLRDFVFALDGNPERTDDGLINFEKLTLLGNLITKLREFQRVPYQYFSLLSLRNLFCSMYHILNVNENTLVDCDDSDADFIQSKLFKIIWLKTWLIYLMNC
jgi:hypothetical protein